MWYLELMFRVHTIEHDGYCSDSECEYTYDEKYIYPVLPDNIEKKETDLSPDTFTPEELYNFVLNAGHIKKLYNYYYGYDKRGNHMCFAVSDSRVSGSGICGRDAIPFECDEYDCNYIYWELEYIKVRYFDE